MKKKFIVICVLVFMAISLFGCGPGQLFGPTLTPTSTSTRTPTVTPTFTATNTPTPTLEFSYWRCTSANYKDCPIPAEDLFNGDYLSFLEFISTPFDTATMKEVPVTYLRIHAGWGSCPQGTPASCEGSEWKTLITYDAPDFEGLKSTKGLESDADFRIFITAGITEYGGHDYIVLPIEYYDENNPERNVWVIGVLPAYYSGQSPSGQRSDDVTAFSEQDWTYVSTIFDSAWFVQFFTKGNLVAGFSDPLVSRTYEEDRNLENESADFLLGKRSGLHGKVLLLDMFEHCLEAVPENEWARRESELLVIQLCWPRWP